MVFKSILTKLFGRKVHPGHLPYVPTPPAHQNTPTSANQNTAPFNVNVSYAEIEADVHSIAGTPIIFGNQRITQVDESGHAHHSVQTQSHIVGSGKLVGSIEPKEVAGQVLPGVAGVCSYCQAEAQKAYENNLISLHDAQVKALYDTSSAERCDICGINACCRHARPIQMPDGITRILCIDCQKQLKRQLIKQKVFGLLISPFMEIENSNNEENNDS